MEQIPSLEAKSQRHAILNLICSLISCRVRVVLLSGLVPQIYEQKTPFDICLSVHRSIRVEKKTN